MVNVLEPVNGRMIAMLSGEIDHHSSAIIRPTIDEAVQRSQPAVLVLDFGGVSFMDSSGIGLVMGRYKLVNEYGGQVEIQNTPTQLRQVMRLAGLSKLARIENGGNGNEAI